MVAATMFASNVLHSFPDSKEITFTIVVLFSMAKANDEMFWCCTYQDCMPRTAQVCAFSDKDDGK